MDDDFRIIVSAKSSCEGSKGATGLQDLFKKDIEELGSSDPDWCTNGVGEVSSVKTEDEKKISGCDVFSSHSSSTTDEDGVSSSVRNLLKLLVKRASTHSCQGLPCADENGFEPAHDGDKTIGADESWTSSMATPSKNCSSFTEVNHSSVIHLNLEDNNVKHGNTGYESDLLADSISCNEEERKSPKAGFSFYGFDDDEKRNSRNSMQGHSIESIDQVSVSNNYVDAVESSCLHNFLIPSFPASSDAEQDNLVIRTSSKNLCWVTPTFPQNDKDSGCSELITAEVDNAKNLEPSLSSDYNFGEHNVRSTHFNLVKTNEGADINSLSSVWEKTEMSCIVNGKGMKESSIPSERALQQVAFSELDSLVENAIITDGPKIIGTCAEMPSYMWGTSEVHHCSLEIDMDNVNRLKVTAEDGNAVMGKNYSGNENRQLNKISDEVCRPGKNTASFADGGLVNSNADFDVARTSKEEPEYVTQILNLICSPPKLSVSNSGRRKRQIDDAETEVVKRACWEKESYCIVQGLMEELWEKLQYKLEEVKISSLTSGCIVVDVDESIQEMIVKCNENNPQIAECENMINNDEGIKFEESNHESWDKDFLKNKFTSISLQHSGKEKLGVVCNPGENLNKSSLSLGLINSSSREQNITTVASEKDMFRAMELSSIAVFSGADAPLTKVGMSASPEADRNALQSSCSKQVVVSNDPQPHVGESVEITLEPENEREYLGTQDFLSCSVLEEVCQASEALAYIGKMKNDCLIGQDSKNEWKFPGECSNLTGEKIEVENGCMAARDSMEMKNVRQAGEIIDASANYCSNGPSVSTSSLSPYGKEKSDFSCRALGEKVTPDGKKYCSYQQKKNSSAKSVKKKIVFTVPGCCEVNEIGDEAYPEVLTDSPEKCTSLSLPPSSNLNHFSSKREKCAVSTSHEGPRKFVYPKQRSQRGFLVPEAVLPEDLMSRAAQLEKHSCLVSNNGKSSLVRLKTRSLVSFSSLEPMGCDESIVIKNEINDRKMKSISLENQSSLEQDKSIKMDTSEDIKVHTLAINKTELGTVVLPMDGTKKLEKYSLATETANTCEMTTEPELTEVTQVVRTPVAIVDGYTLNMESKGSEQNMEMGERDSICTSPILTKFRTKKPFIRRNKNKFNTSRPMKKKNLAGVMTELKSNTDCLREKVNFIENMESNHDTEVENNSCISAACVRKEKSETEKTGEYDFSPQSESILELSVTMGASREIVQLEEYNPLSNKGIQLEDNSNTATIDVKFSTVSWKEKNIPENSFLKAKRHFSKDSTPVRSGDVGFSTASGKKVAISENSLNKAKQLFAEDAESLGGDEMGLSTASGNKFDVSAKSLLKSRMLPFANSTPVRSDTVGFSTASGKKVAISESSLKKAKQLFAEDAESLGGDEMGLSTASGNKFDVSAKSLLKSRMLPFANSTPVRSDTVGFSTASGKKVAISESSLKKAKQLFAEDAESLGGDEMGLSTASGNKFDVSAKSLLKSRMLPFANSTPVRSDTVGFSTASGKKVAISESSLNKAKQLFAEDAESLGGDEMGLSTASGNKFDVSAKSLLKSRMLPFANSTPVRSDTVGFSTASGKKVAISESSLKKAKQLFAEDAESLGGDEMGLSTASGNKFDVSAKSLLKSRMLPFANSTPVRSDTVGFSTASGKKVAISESSLKKAKQLFAEDAESLGGDEMGLSTASGNKFDVSAKSLLKSRMLPFANSTPVRSDTVGFSTASGKKVAISESSLNKAKKLFVEDAELSGSDDGSVRSTASGRKVESSAKSLVEKWISGEGSTPGRIKFAEFSSASGKKESVSEKSLAHAKTLFADDVCSLGNDNLDLSAGGTKVDISVQSLLKSDLISCVNTTPVESDVGFPTASVNKVTVSESSLIEAKKLFTEEAELSGVDNSLALSMSGKKIEASAKSLVKRNMLSFEGLTPGRTEFAGFSSASGKKVSVSEKSLAHAKKLFSEELNNRCVDSNTAKAMHTSVHPLETTQEGEPAFQCPEQKCEESKLITVSENSMPQNLNNTKSNSLSNEHPNPVIIQGKEVVSNVEHVNCLETVPYSKLSNIDPGSCIPPWKSESSLFNPNKRSIELDHEKQYDGFKEQCITPTQDIFFTESQGDDYIKAVDVAVLNTPSVPIVDQNPPSPVFKTMRKRRLKMKRVGKKWKVAGGLGTQTKLASKTSVGGVSDGFSVENDSLISSQSSLVTQEGECRDKEKYSDLWGGDVADESWLGKQLELAEESGAEVKFGVDTYHWVEGRKIQEETISSKKNVKPIIGHCLQVRRGMGQQRSSLRHFVKGKRPGQYPKDKLRKFGIQEETLNITSTNAADFKFKLQDHYKEFQKGDGVLVKDGFRLIPDVNGMFGVTEAQSALLAGPGVDPNLLPAGDWCRNHYRWIIWKLASYEKSFPLEFGRRCLTPENLMCQLKYRWDREVDCGERSAIRKILEKDDTASKRMILCVSDIKKTAMPASSKKLELDLIASSSLLELTDGWYCINGIVDSELAHLIQRGHLTIGTKIVTSGAELINGPPNGCSPLEPLASASRIRLSANSTRRARWDARLGYVCGHPGPLPVSVHSLLPGGGAIGVLSNVLLARVYPILSIERTLDGRRVVRSKRAEARAVAKYEFEREAWLESVYSNVSAEMQRELEEEAKRQKGKRAPPEGGGSGRSFKHARRSRSIYVESGKNSILSPQGETVPVEELSRLVDESGDPAEVQKLLTTSQVDMISAYRQESRDRFLKELEDRVKQKIKQEEEKLMSDRSWDSICADGCSSAGRKNRDVVNLLKVRLVAADQPVIAKSAVFTVWRPSEDVISLLAKEGTILNIYGLTANGVRSNFIQLSSGKHTRYKLKKSQAYSVHLMESVHLSLRREILSQGFDDYKFNSGPGCNSSLPPFGEIDLVAMVIRVGKEPDRSKGQGFQHVYVAGSDGSLLSLAFWGGIQEFAVEEFLNPGSIVVVCNLQWRRLHGLHRITTAQVIETSSFTLHPVEERLKVILKAFMVEIEAEKQLQLNGVEFIQSCEQKLDAVLGLEWKEIGVSSCLKEGTSIGSKIILDPFSVPASVENLSSIRPSVAARMKKLQMYEGSAEIPLPACHMRKSASVIKAFQPPKKCPVPSTSSSHESKSVEAITGRCQYLNSEVNTANDILSENKNIQFSDTDSPPMSLDSDPQE